MKTLDQIAKNYKSQTLDGRDLNRLATFIPFDKLKSFGLEAKGGITEEEWNKDVKPFTKENILEQLKSDVAFGFYKALNRRGISSSLMAEVVCMWNWILEEGLEEINEANGDYSMYGLPIFKATAIKYGFDNPIGEDLGSEAKYNEYED